MKKTVLIIDDEPGIQDVLESVFESEFGFTEIHRANDGLEGFHFLQKEKYDIITLDHMMPFLKGADLLMALRQKSGPNQNTPVCFISAYIPELPAEVKNCENTFFLEKPVDFDRLHRYVKMSLVKKDSV